LNGDGRRIWGNIALMSLHTGGSSIVLAALLVQCAYCAPKNRTGKAHANANAAAASETTPKQGQATLIVTTQGAPFVRSQLTRTASAQVADVEVFVGSRKQEIKGFGGALNEKGWQALAVLSDSDRAAVLQSLFDPKLGLRLNMARIPIGASDYALDRYTLDEHPNDYEMRHFSIDRDTQRLIPYVLAAQALKPDLMVWASAWTPPTWMKTNAAYDSGAMKDDSRIYDAYALYLAKFVEAYAERGIRIAMVVPQNEPGQLTHYPSCEWKPQQYVKFIGEHLGPLFRTRRLPTRIFVGTINRDDWDVLSVLSQPSVSSQVAGVAVQWEGRHWLDEIQRQFPALEVMQSETECGNNHWQPQFDAERPPNDFGYAAFTWRKFQEFIEGGSSSYMLWNLVLDEQGKNIDAERAWPQNAPIVVDQGRRSVVYTPMFWATKHFSGLLDPRSRLVESKGNYRDRIAFVSPDEKAVVQLLNAEAKPASIAVQVEQNTFRVEMPPQSFASLIVAR
jgi:glucosylceramidase